MRDEHVLLDPYLARWDLRVDGDARRTHSSLLLPVVRAGRPLMLKLAFEVDEQEGAELLAWWQGDGAAEVFAHDGEAVLMERATGPRSLAAMVERGDDDAATRILCDTLARLHAPRPNPPAKLVTLDTWFADLWTMAEAEHGTFARCAKLARTLIDAERECRPLHGDVHHDNVLDFGARGFLAIDPKHLFGDRAFDYANLFVNPEGARPLARRYFGRRVALVSEHAGIERQRLLSWVAAWCGLSAAWWRLDGLSPDFELGVAELALQALSAP